MIVPSLMGTQRAAIFVNAGRTISTQSTICSENVTEGVVINHDYQNRSQIRRNSHGPEWDGLKKVCYFYNALK